MKTFVTQTLMCAPKATRRRDFGYNVYVMLDTVPEWLRAYVTSRVITQGPDGCRVDCLTFANATQSRKHADMAPSYEKLLDWQKHETASRVAEWQIVNRVFPATKALQLDTMPLLWVTYPTKRRFNSGKRWA